jgi:hypothetical protein
MTIAVSQEWMLQARTGLQHPHRGAPSSGGQGDILPLVPPEVPPALKAPRASPDDLATELNPHEPELNPHEAAPAASRARNRPSRLPALGPEPAGAAAGKGGAVTPPAIRCAHDAPLPPPAELARKYSPDLGDRGDDLRRNT